MASKQTSRQEQQEKERKQLFAKDFVKNNPIFTQDHILELQELFNLYADPATKRVDIRDILQTAATLELNKRYTIVFKALQDLHESYHDDFIDFETFVKDLTAKMGNPFDTEGRRSIWELCDMEAKESLDAQDIRVISDELRFNLNDDDIKEIIQNIGGYEADSIPYDKFEKYLARKVHRRQLEAEVLKQ